MLEQDVEEHTACGWWLLPELHWEQKGWQWGRDVLLLLWAGLSSTTAKVFATSSCQHLFVFEFMKVKKISFILFFFFLCWNSAWLLLLFWQPERCWNVSPFSKFSSWVVRWGLSHKSWGFPSAASQIIILISYAFVVCCFLLLKAPAPGITRMHENLLLLLSVMCLFFLWFPAPRAVEKLLGVIWKMKKWNSLNSFFFFLIPVR